MYTIQDIEKMTGLQVSFVRRCLSELEHYFKGHTSRGDKNAVLIDAYGLTIFQQIQQYKSDGLSIPTIKGKLQKHGVKDSQAKTPVSPVSVQTPSNTDELKELYDRLDQERQRFIDEKTRALELEKDLQELQAALKGRDTELLALTDGRTVDEAIRSRRLEERRRQAHERREAQRQARRLDILADLEAAQGLFAGGRRRALLAELRELEREQQEQEEHQNER